MNLINQIFICDFFYCHRMTQMKQTSIWLNMVNLVITNNSYHSCHSMITLLSVDSAQHRHEEHCSTSKCQHHYTR